jgi:hypothetical protein
MILGSTSTILVPLSMSAGLALPWLSVESQAFFASMSLMRSDISAPDRFGLYDILKITPDCHLQTRA